jgi:hypothetical protein
VPDETTPPHLWALPGLVDAHAHIGRSSTGLQSADLEEAGANARAALNAGVGLVLDKGWVDLTVVEMTRQVPANERPEIEAAGVILAVEGGYWAGMGRDIAPGRLAQEMERAAREGIGWVKLIGDWPRKGIGPVANFTEGELAEAVEIARANKARVAVHTMAREVPEMAVRAGADSIEHGLFLSPEDLGALGERGGIWVPTVTQVETLIQELGPGSSMKAEAVIDAVSWSGYRATGRSSPFAVGEEANAVLFAEDPIADPGVLAFPLTVVRMGRLVA